VGEARVVAYLAGLLLESEQLVDSSLRVALVAAISARLGRTCQYTYGAQLLRLWNRRIGLLRKVPVGLEHLSARHGGGVVTWFS
jgi:hypothetical protein